MTVTLFWCAVITGNFGFDIVDCYDSKKVCVQEYSSFECTICSEEGTQTFCPSFGAVSYD